MSSRIADLPRTPQAAWQDVLRWSEVDQATLWLDLAGRRWDAAVYRSAVARAEVAAAQLQGLDLATWLEGRGFSVMLSTAPCTYGTAVVRALVDLEAARVTIYQGAVEALAGWLPAPVVHDVLVAHETFHIVDPSCPDALAEMAAHVFAGRVTRLGGFAGLLDIVDWIRRWPEQECLSV